ncbi:ankyrin repeat domain-containing protein [Ottowia thiooxydans]|uniref:ankyrin repeat domain-containing protein n=1 Tax=Ottowia thiooxydans TaxID=219182 RepID=UPI00056BED21|nr:ankyrin repeat domain-containing protein [Ottowia thiooxydans]
MLGRAGVQDTSPQIALRSLSSANIKPVPVLRQQGARSDAFISGTGVGTPLEDDKSQCAQVLGSTLSFPECSVPVSTEQREVPAAVGPGGYTGERAIALQITAELGPLEQVHALRQVGARVDGDINGPIASRAMRSAALAGRVDLVAGWIAAGADINAPNANGTTALMIAAQLGHADVVCLLIQAGALTDMVNRNGETAFTLALVAGNVGIAKSLHLAGEKAAHAVTPSK